MKSGVLAVVVGGVFVLGVVAGSAFFAQRGEPGDEAKPGAVAPEAAPGERERLAPQPTGDATEGGGVAASADGGQGGQAGAPDGPPTIPALGGSPARPPAIPAPPSPEALREAERLAAEKEQLGDEGHGKTRALVYEFESEEARLEHEAARRANWEARLDRENAIKIKGLRESVGLSAAQEGRLQEILDTQLEERMRLVDALAAKEITRTTFDQGVRDSIAAARQALQTLLTPEQYEAYAKLKPREQVLQDETK